MINPMSHDAIYHQIDPNISPLVSTDPYYQLRKDYKKSNPMYSTVLRPTGKTDAYQNYLRTLTVDFFIDAETFESDFPRYAEIALELENYEFATDCYWMLWRNADFEEKPPPITIGVEHKTRDEDAILFYKFRYEYAASKLPNSTLEQSKQQEKRFKRLDKKLRKRKKKHSTYKKFIP